jgi:hypothetical protein
MVRFSDLLGGQETPEDKPVADAPAIADDVAEPEDVLERLTQYATSARAADHTPTPEAIAEPPSPETESAPDRDAEPGADDAASSLAPVADDLLPRSKGRKGRS